MNNNEFQTIILEEIKQLNEEVRRLNEQSDEFIDEVLEEPQDEFIIVDDSDSSEEPYDEFIFVDEIMTVLYEEPKKEKSSVFSKIVGFFSKKSSKFERAFDNN